MAKLQGGRATPLKNEHSFVRLAMANVPTLRALDPRTRRQLQRHLNCRSISSGATLLMGQGNRDDIFFFLSGKAVAMNTSQSCTTFQPLKVGDVFIDEGYGLEFNRPKSVILDTDCVICSMPSKNYWQLVHSNPQTRRQGDWCFGAPLYRVLANIFSKHHTT